MENQDDNVITLDLDEAIAFFEDAKSSDFFEDPATAYQSLAHVYRLKGLMGQARDELKQGLEKMPDSQTLQLMLDHVERSIH